MTLFSSNFVVMIQKRCFSFHFFLVSFSKPYIKNETCYEKKWPFHRRTNQFYRFWSMQFCHENLQKVFVWLKRITHEKMLFQLYRVHNMRLGRSLILWFELQLFSIVYHVFDFPFLMSAIILLLFLLFFSLSFLISRCVCISFSFISLYIQPINIFIDTGNI